LRLRQVLVNLVDNAIKFSDGGEVVLTVAFAAAADGDDGLLRIEVADQGIGMPANVLARLFQPFEQADVSTTRRYGGTGLGLAISRQLTRLLGGDLVAASAVGHGSRFRLTVATGPVAGVARGTVGTAEPVPVRDTAKPLAGTRVLLVEDGPDNQRLLRHVLERAGCRLEIVGNGQACLDRMALPDAAFDVVLMDMQMPVMDGLTATRALRQRACAVPIVSLTANAMQSDRDRAFAAGCDAFLSKPIDRKQLFATIGEWRGRRSGVAVPTT
jgi:CheY-like chemotaxis protein